MMASGFSPRRVKNKAGSNFDQNSPQIDLVFLDQASAPLNFKMPFSHDREIGYLRSEVGPLG